MAISRKLKSRVLSMRGIWILLIPLKFLHLFSSRFMPQIRLLCKWAFSSREVTNHSYHNSAASIKRLASVLASIDGLSASTIKNYCDEIRASTLLQGIYLSARAKEKMLANLTDGELRAGRQLLYYCLTRAARPRIVFEAGTAHGTGSLLILHALTLNEAEGFSGKLITVDINPDAGRILSHLPHAYSSLLDFRRGEADSLLAELNEKIDLFFHDTVNIPSHEERHYTLLETRLSERGIICSTWGTSGVLASHSEKLGRGYMEFTNQPDGHWCSDTIGISLPLALQPKFSAVAVRRAENATVTAITPAYTLKKPPRRHTNAINPKKLSSTQSKA